MICFELKKVSIAIILGASCLVTGCATTATGVSQSAFNSTSATQILTAKAPEGTVMAVVRYPAFVDGAAEDAYYEAFSRMSIGGSVAAKDASSPEVMALADSMIVKSNYFALSLFKELAAKLPEHSVLLSPHKIELDAKGQLTSTPMTEAESISNVVTVDFTSYTYPDPTKMMGKEPLTFGDIVTPLVTVRTQHHAAVPTHGLLMSSQNILPRAAGNGRAAITDSLEAMQNGRLDSPVPELDFIAHLRGGETAQVSSASFRNAPLSFPTRNAVSSYPLEKIKLNSASMKSLNAKGAGNLDPLQTAFSNSFANQIVGMINRVDIDKATLAGRAAAIAQFDESLAALTLVGAQDADYIARMRYAERLLVAEQKYLSVQSLRLFDGVHNGEMGAQVRDMLKAEYDVLETRRKLARQQNTATALAILGAVGAVGVVNSTENGQTSVGQSIAINALIRGAIFAGQQAYSKNKQSKGVGGNYLASIVPALDEQTSIQVNLIDSNETITAIRFEDLRAKLQTLYNDNQRSLDTVATRCRYTHQGQSLSGTWLGVCENGLANGTGVGVLRHSDGREVEYYGYAQNGQPHGPGFQISHGLSSSQSLEGNFTQGQADGVMRVSAAGKPDQLRRYSRGSDIGAASGSASVISPFNLTPSAAQSAAGLLN